MFPERASEKRGFYSRERFASIWNSKNAGKPAFTAKCHNRYYVGNLLKRQMRAHVVAWALTHGRWPDGEIDHIDGNGLNNALCNLREVSHRENGRNIKRPVHNTSGHIGVSWSKTQRKWHAYIGDPKCGDRVNIGMFGNKSDAVKARKAAQRTLGYHPNHGRDVR